MEFCSTPSCIFCLHRYSLFGCFYSSGCISFYNKLVCGTTHFVYVFCLFASSVICLIVTIADAICLSIKKDFHFAIYTTIAVVVILIFSKIPILVFVPIIGWVFVLGATINKLFKKIF